MDTPISTHSVTTQGQSELSKEVIIGRMLGTFSAPPLENLFYNLMGMVYKAESTQIRLIYNLATPKID